jgi:hypothetical protein
VSIYDLLANDPDLTPASIAAFLGSTGWELQLADDAKEVWGLREDGSARAKLLLPLDPTYVDYHLRLREALNRLCDVFDWDAQQLFTNIMGARSDMFYIRADQFMRDGSIPLRQARDLIEGASTLLEAAALASIDPRPRYAGRRPNTVRDFVEDDVRMGHTQRGSFIITVMTRLDEDDVLPAPESDGQTTDSEKSDRPLGVDGERPPPSGATEESAIVRLPPFQRRVMATLATALTATQELAQLGQYSTSRLDRAVMRGMSTNFCDSLSQMTKFDGLRTLDLSFRWARAEALPPPETDNIVLNRDQIPHLDEISQRLRSVPERQRTTIYGQVTRLERGEEDDEGVVTVNGVTGRSTRRSARLRLSGRQYDSAVRAHRNRTTVTATGDLLKLGNAYWLTGAIDIEYALPPAR